MLVRFRWGRQRASIGIFNNNNNSDINAIVCERERNSFIAGSNGRSSLLCDKWRQLIRRNRIATTPPPIASNANVVSSTKLLQVIVAVLIIIIVRQQLIYSNSSIGCYFASLVPTIGTRWDWLCMYEDGPMMFISIIIKTRRQIHQCQHQSYAVDYNNSINYRRTGWPSETISGIRYALRINFGKRILQYIFVFRFRIPLVCDVSHHSEPHHALYLPS